LEIPYSGISDKKQVLLHLQYSAERTIWLTCVALLLHALQVKELGIYFANCPQIAKTVEVYFQNLWTLSTLNSTSYTKQAWDKEWQVSRKVPCWSHFLQPKERCRFATPSAVRTDLLLSTQI
jgi:hypothetical protein